jgi:hypothetical protein
MALKLIPVDETALHDKLTAGTTSGRASKGTALLEQFLQSDLPAAELDCGSTKERNSVALSTANAVKASGAKVWVRKEGGGTGTRLLLINLAKASAATKRAYESRPRVGRKPNGG